MVDFRLKLIVAVVVLFSVLATSTFWTLRSGPGDFAPARCLIINSTRDSSSNTRLINAKINVNGQINNSDTDNFQGFATRGSMLTMEGADDFLSRYHVNNTFPCWRNMQRTTNEYLARFGRVRLTKPIHSTKILDDNEMLKSKMRSVALIMAVGSALAFFVLLAYIFRAELVRCCPRFVLTMLMNTNTFANRWRRRRRPPPPPSPPSVPIIARPPTVTSRKRISSLIESAKLSETDSRALRAEGWSCCICLEEEAEEQHMRAVSRLECNHATHSDCLRSWLEKGRAVCVLCNAHVFPDVGKDTAMSSGRSSLSVDDHGASDSLVVEQTEETPSSLGTSIVMEVSVPPPLLDPVVIARFNERNL